MPKQEQVTVVEPKPAAKEVTDSQQTTTQNLASPHGMHVTIRDYRLHVTVPDYRLHCTVPHRGRRG